MKKEGARILAQTIRSMLPTLAIAARRTVPLNNDYHVFISLPNHPTGFILRHEDDWQHFQDIASLLVSTLLAAPLSEEVRPRFSRRSQWFERLPLDPLPSDTDRCDG